MNSLIVRNVKELLILILQFSPKIWLVSSKPRQPGTSTLNQYRFGEFGQDLLKLPTKTLGYSRSTLKNS